MLKFKKMGLFLLGIVAIFGVNLMYATLSIPGPQDHKYAGSLPKVDDQELTGSDPIGQGIDTTANKGSGILHLPQSSNYDTNLGYILAIIQIAINWILAMLSFVALVYMLYCGFLVLSSGSDDKNASKGISGIKTALVAIAGIGLAWLVISAMIWLINTVAVSAN